MHLPIELLCSGLLPFLETAVSEIEEKFKSFTNRQDIAIVLINQNVREL